MDKLKKVDVSVTHGDLWFSRHPVLLGHYLGDGILSAEAYVNACLDGQLSHHNQLGIYPGEIGASQLFLPSSETRFSGALIVGLGDFGKLSPGNLAKSISLALKSLAAENKQSSSNEPNGISCLLVGTQYGSFSIRQSIQSILLGIRQANQSLENSSSGGFKPIEEVEFVEIYEDKAITAMHTLKGILEEDWSGSKFQLASQYLKRTPGRRKRALNVVESDWWQRLVVQKKEGRVNFTFLTDRARAEVTDVRTQDRIVKSLISKSSVHTKWDSGMARLMFELLVPNEMKELGSERKNTIFLLDKETAQMPWELIHDTANGEHEPIAVRAGLIRQLETSSFRRDVTHTQNKSLLVVGDPKTKLPDLFSARMEADEVEAVFENADDTYSVESSIQETGIDILKKVFNGSYQIMHLAGHGILGDSDSNLLSGLAIGDEMSLSSDELSQLRVVPELVFVNCCHLGSIQKNENEMSTNVFAANVGISLIEIGVRAVIVAGWAIEDGAASEFASTFYRHLLQGDNFGDAVLKARRSIFESYPDSNTWGAYQAYGDPFYTLRTQKTSSKSREHGYADPIEPVIDLYNIQNSAKNGSERKRKASLEAVEKVVKKVEKVNKEWLKDAKIIENVASAYYGLGEYENAIYFFDQLAKLEDADYSVTIIEKIANAKIRHGISLFLNGNKDDMNSRRLISEAMSQLEILLQIGQTSERFSLLGGAYKRFALVESNVEGRLKSLKHSCSNYRQAFEMSWDNKTDASYPLLNFLALEEIGKLLGDQTTEKDMVLQKKAIKETMSVVEREYKRNPSIWKILAYSDAKILKVLQRKARRPPNLRMRFRPAMNRSRV